MSDQRLKLITNEKLQGRISSMKNRILGWAVVSVLVITVFMGLGFRLNHLQGGIGSALGSAQTSLAVYKNGTSAKVGDKVVVNIKDSGPQLGIIKSATDSTIDVDLGAAFVRVESSEILGKSIAVIPFFGSLLEVVGL